jgi:hypothetical protein
MDAISMSGGNALEGLRANVAELVDARDLKSLDGNVVRVRFPPFAPSGLWRLRGELAKFGQAFQQAIPSHPLARENEV